MKKQSVKKHSINQVFITIEGKQYTVKKYSFQINQPGKGGSRVTGTPFLSEFKITVESKLGTAAENRSYLMDLATEQSKKVNGHIEVQSNGSTIETLKFSQASINYYTHTGDFSSIYLHGNNKVEPVMVETFEFVAEGLKWEGAQIGDIAGE